jgi:hypothetical protein
MRGDQGAWATYGPLFEGQIFFDNKRVQLHVSLICQMPTNVSNLAAL